LVVLANDYFYEGIPESAPVGTRLSLFNASTVEFHELIILKLNPTEQRTTDELSQLSLDELNRFAVGTVQSVVFAMPESEQYSFAAGSPVLAEEGRYLIFCAINVGSDPIDVRNETGQGPTKPIEGVPRHYQVGMMTEIAATG
jgi:hypothetical protein